MFKLVAGLLAALLLVWAPTPVGDAPLRTFAVHGPATSTQQAYTINLDAIRLVMCATTPKGVSIEKAKPEDVQLESGTGTVIGHDRVITAAHVVRGASACTYQGHLVQVIYQDDALDMAVLAVPLGDHPPMVPISCDGLKNGDYLAIGYAQGHDFALQRISFSGRYVDIVDQDSDGSDQHAFKHGGLMEGRTFPGMSGGPVIDRLGRVTAILVAGPEEADVSFIRDLIDTPLCAAMKAPPKPVVAPATNKPLKTQH